MSAIVNALVRNAKICSCVAAAAIAAAEIKHP